MVKPLDKRGRLGVGLISVIIITIIVLVIIMTVLADTSTDVGAAAGNMSGTNITGELGVTRSTDPQDVLPLTSFFGKKGIILLAFIAGIVVVVITALLKFGK